MSTPFIESSIYKQGQMYVELGQLLMNPNTDIKSLSDFGRKYNLDLDIIFKIISNGNAK